MKPLHLALTGLCALYFTGCGTPKPNPIEEKRKVCNAEVEAFDWNTIPYTLDSRDKDRLGRLFCYGNQGSFYPSFQKRMQSYTVSRNIIERNMKECKKLIPVNRTVILKDPTGNIKDATAQLYCRDIEPEFNQLKRQLVEKEFSPVLFRENPCGFSYQGNEKKIHLKKSIELTLKWNELEKFQNNTPIMIENIEYNFVPDSFSLNDNRLNVSVVSVKNYGKSDFSMEITNKTNEFIELENIMNYYGSDITPVSFSAKNLAPNSVVTVNGTIKNAYVPLTQKNQTHAYGFAIKYKAVDTNVNKTLYKQTPIAVDDNF